MSPPTPAGAWPTATTRVAAVIGRPVAHSLSPVLHNAAFAALGLDWAYLAFEVAPGEAGVAVAGARALGIDGLSVTMPHKEAVVPALDRLSATAERLGAVNTVVRVGSSLVGESTDGQGFLDALRDDQGFDPAGRRCLVLGAGGAARAVALALAGAGAAEVVVVGRSPERVATAAAVAGPVARPGVGEEASSADLVVNATPIGMAGHPAGPPVDPALLSRGQVVIDLVYHPAVTPLLAAARERGAVAAGGLGMLVHQAAHAFRLWTGQHPPLEAMSAAVLKALAPAGAGRGAGSAGGGAPLTP
ncbi:MAG: shikimate dehydrogenase [Actinomycetota bacterium]|nr:shikimate dehydrogenase [Actinomycetota bacterium]